MKSLMLVAGSVVLVGIISFGRAEGQAVKAELRNAQGEAVGTVSLTQGPTAVTIAVEASKLPPGIHGFHVHAVGRCDPPGFSSAGDHFNPAGRAHPAHAGDLPVLLANADGGASMTVKTDRFKVEDLFDADGSAIIIHALPDNYAHIPTDRYRPNPDATTLATGDAGERIACGLITR